MFQPYRRSFYFVLYHILSEQEKLSDIYGWTSVVVMTCFFIQFSAAGILKIVKRFVFEMDNKVSFVT